MCVSVCVRGITCNRKHISRSECRQSFDDHVLKLCFVQSVCQGRRGGACVTYCTVVSAINDFLFFLIALLLQDSEDLTF